MCHLNSKAFSVLLHPSPPKLHHYIVDEKKKNMDGKAMEVEEDRRGRILLCGSVSCTLAAMANGNSGDIV